MTTDETRPGDDPRAGMTQPTVDPESTPLCRRRTLRCIRGLICRDCNAAIGLLGDDAECVRSASGQARQEAHLVDCGVDRCDKPDPYACRVHGVLHQLHCLAEAGAS